MKKRLRPPELERHVEVGVPGGAGVPGVGPSPPPKPSQVVPVGHGWHGKQRLRPPELERHVEVGVSGGAGVRGVGPSPPSEPSQVVPQCLPLAAPGPSRPQLHVPAS